MKIENMLQRLSCVSFLFKPPWLYHINLSWKDGVIIQQAFVVKLLLLKFRQSFDLQCSCSWVAFVLFICKMWPNSSRTWRKFSCPRGNIEIFKNVRLFYYRNSNFSCFCQLKCYLNTVFVEVNRFKTEIVRASEEFIPGPVPKLLLQPTGVRRC